MIPDDTAAIMKAVGIPRESGDDPVDKLMVRQFHWYSPRERG